MLSKIRYPILIAFLALASFAFATDLTLDAFSKNLAEKPSMEARKAYCSEVIQTYNSPDLWRNAIEQWKQIDSSSATKWLAEMLAKEPTSAKYQYLSGRWERNLLSRAAIARRVVKAVPDADYGYRLLLSSYSSLIDGSAPAELKKEFEKWLTMDEPLLEKYPVLVTETSEESMKQLFSFYLFRGRFDDAKKLLTTARDSKQRWASVNQEAILLARQGKFYEAKKLLEEDTDKIVEAQKLSEKEREEYIVERYTGALRQVKAYDKIVDYLKSLPKYEENSMLLYMLAFYQALANLPDDAFATLEVIAQQGSMSADQVKSDEDFTSIHSDPRWEPMLKKLAEGWSRKAEDRRTAVLAEKIDRTPPTWALADSKGDTIRLADLRGNVVILDFWATWCGPCRMAMPVLDEFMKKRMPKGVKVFSINVWENDRPKATKFIKDNNYSMKLVFGSDEPAKAYGITGIPYLCVIDKEGKLRFEEKGYSDALKEKLDWWAADLLK
ncbi:MAG: TlpA family protein disulfide reductase [bacterium]|nr:TlpA family protein disulfide reductase [bacterium]